MSNIVLISLGSNLGNREENICQAIQKIQLELGKVLAISHTYETESWGYNDRPYLNNAICISTSFHPLLLMDSLFYIESSLGRKRKKKEGYEARIIDLDIILVKGLVINHSKLKVPHPHMHHRRFVLQPLVDIAPDWPHELKKISLSELLMKCKDGSKIKKVGKISLYSR